MHSYRSRLRGNLQAEAEAPEASSFSLSDPIDPRGSCSDLIPNVLLFVDAPALDVSQLPDGATLTYTLLECRDSQLSDVNVSTVMGVQTGAGGRGAAAVSFAARSKWPGGSLFWGLRIDASAHAEVAGERFVLELALTGTPN